MIEDNTSFVNGVQRYWDSTSLQWAQQCPKLYEYNMVCGLAPARLSYHLTFGQHYASAIEHYHKLRAKGISLDEAIIEIVHMTLKNTWEIVGSKDGEPIGKPWESYDNNKNRETLIRSIIWYIDEFAEDSLQTVILPDGSPAVEYSFTLAIDNGNYFCGHIDRLAAMADDYYITDQKTTGSTLTPKYFDQYNPHTQMSLYTFAGRAIYDLPVKGVVIDAAQIAVGFTRFERGFTFRTDTQLDEWYEDTLNIIENIQYYTNQNHFPMNPTACGNFGGCAFRHVCSKSPEVREQFIKADFIPKKWDPLERR